MARASKKEVIERTNICVALLAQGYRKHKIKEHLLNKEGIGARQAENYISRARAQLLEELGESKESHRANSLEFYRVVARGANYPIRDRLFAQKRIDELLGLDMPVRRELSGPDGKAIPIESKRSVKDMSREELLELISREDED